MKKEKLRHHLEEMVKLYEIPYSDRIEIESRIEQNELASVKDLLRYIGENDIGNLNSRTINTVSIFKIVLLVILATIFVYNVIYGIF